MYLSEDFSGQHTVLDTRDANDPDYVPESSKTPNMNVSTHLNIRLGMLAPELERDWRRNGVEGSQLHDALGGIISKRIQLHKPQDCDITIQAGEWRVLLNGIERKIQKLASRTPVGLCVLFFRYGIQP